MDTEHTKLDGVLVITPKRFGDSRGFFAETWNKAALAKQGLDIDFVQDNHSLSQHAGTVRGLHFQAPPHGQAKLVRCGRGRIFDVAVDVRKGSSTYGDWVGIELSAENGKQLFVPEGFLHGFMTLEPDSEIVYKCSDYYAPDHEGSVHWESCGIEWPLPSSQYLLSDKDASAQTLAEFKTPFEI